MNELTACRRDCYLPKILNTQQTQQTNIHAVSVIRTGDPWSQAAAELRVKPHGHRDGQKCESGTRFPSEYFGFST